VFGDLADGIMALVELIADLLCAFLEGIAMRKPRKPNGIGLV
jgi:hypothetical protein